MTKIVRPKVDGAASSGESNPVAPPSTGAPAPGATETRRRPLVPPRAPSASKTRNKVLLSVADGKIEWDKMTSESRRAFEEMFRDPEFLKEFGLTGREKFDPEQMKAIYDGISMVYQSAMAMLAHWPMAALKLLAYTDEQKNMLAGPTAKLADKYAAKVLRDNQEVIIFFSVFAMATQKNFIAAFEEVKKENAKKHQQPHQQPQPIRVQAAAAGAGTAPANRPAPNVTVPFVPPPDSTFDNSESASLG
jgi:hypothetical protein